MNAIVIAFVSGKGGTGKSTTAVNVGEALAALGNQVLLAEVNNAFRSVDVIAGVSDQTVYDLEDVLAGRVEPQKAMVKSLRNDNFRLIPAPYANGRVTTAGIAALCKNTRADFDYILLDVAPGLGEPFRASVRNAHRLMLVLTSDPISLRSGRLLVDSIRGGENNMRLIFNRVDVEWTLKEDALPDLDEAIDTVGIQLLGVVPESKSIKTAAVGGAGLSLRSREKLVYEAIARRITGEEVPLQLR